MNKIKTLIAIAFLAVVGTKVTAATITHTGPEPSAVFLEIHTYNLTPYIAERVLQQNWAATASAPYTYWYEGLTAAGTAISGEHYHYSIDSFSSGSHSNCTDEYYTVDGTVVSHVTNPSPVSYPFDVFTKEANGNGFQRDLTDGFVSCGSSIPWEGDTCVWNSTKRFKLTGNAGFQSSVTFHVNAWIWNKDTCGETAINPATTSIFLNNTTCTSSGNVSLLMYADDTWHDLTVTVYGQANIRYELTYVSNTNPG